MSNFLSRIILQCDNKLIQNQSVVLTREMKKQLSISIIFQLLRGKHSRAHQSNIYSEVLPSVIVDARERFIPIDETKEKILKAFIEDDDYFKLASMQVTFDAKKLEKYINILFHKCFLVYRIIGDENFITSDNSVMFLDALSFSAKPFSNGLAKNTTVVVLPISPKLIVAVYNPNLYFGMMSEYDEKLIYLDSNKEQSFIKLLNDKQYEQCFNQVYANNKEILEKLLII